jgi:hypothetical protein
MPKSQIKTCLDADLAKEIREVSRKRGVSISGLIERAIDRYLFELNGRAVKPKKSETQD